ncbi:myb-related transcription factor, partner of profilin-like [Poeciliopsis prolifica]|uniref:myb-related transcription factor, partner of profilin-like n=1 Tax=Poeciliopsis prolifica TaxID=188132 RepID=UPI0024139843|nr:myb-related transcription factor, partner of profilin-like [Poeciliopsis prolifica]
MSAIMDRLGEQSSRKRKMKFEALALKVLVEEACAHSAELKQKHLSVARRNAIWEAICEKVNAVSRTRRSPDEVKRRWQDFRRRTKEKLSLNKSTSSKSVGAPVEEIPLTMTEQTLLETFSDEQIVGIQGCDLLEHKIVNQAGESLSDGRKSPPSSEVPTSENCPAEPRRCPDCDDVDLERKQERNQTDSLQAIAQEIRAVANVARAFRRDAQAIVAHTRQLVSAVTGLTVAVNALAGVGGSVPKPAPPVNEVVGERTSGHRGNLRKRKAPNKNIVLKKRK